MNIQFDWDFGDEGDSEKEAWAASTSARRSRPAQLTAGQRRSHAALARIRLWLFSDAQPELTARSAIVSLRMARFLMSVCARKRYRSPQMVLTARQRRLYAALARIRPWLCPEGLRE